MSPAPSPAKLAANRANALRSTGPRTEAGKISSSRNSLRHGFCGRVAVLAEEDQVPYALTGKSFVTDLQPVGILEEELLKTIHDSVWQLNRARALGEQLFQELAARGQNVADTAAECEKLGRYQARLERTLNKALEQLRKTQETRRLVEREQQIRAHETRTNIRFDPVRDRLPAPVGFVPQNSYSYRYLDRLLNEIAAEHNPSPPENRPAEVAKAA